MSLAKKNDEGGFVYSTNPDFRREESEAFETLPPSQQDLRIWLEKNHRGGKTACVIKGFVGTAHDLDELGRTLKSKCGTGGSAKDGEIIIQGDHRDKILGILVAMGYKARKAGG
ncbi:MAG: hypothetical protein RL220_1917 [Bacteroidota bacterium]